METLEHDRKVLHRLIVDSEFNDGITKYGEAGYLYFDITEYYPQNEGHPMISERVRFYDYHGYLEEHGLIVSPSDTGSDIIYN